MEHINEIEMEKESQESIVRLAGMPDVTQQGMTGCLSPENSPPTLPLKPSIALTHSQDVLPLHWEGLW
jgi:hypothetical protein